MKPKGGNKVSGDSEVHWCTYVRTYVHMYVSRFLHGHFCMMCASFCFVYLYCDRCMPFCVLNFTGEQL